jgi:hypothetical protein
MKVKIKIDEAYKVQGALLETEGVELFVLRSALEAYKQDRDNYIRDRRLAGEMVNDINRARHNAVKEASQ